MNGNVLQYVQDCFTLFTPGFIADGSAYQVDIELKLTGDLAEMNGKNSCSFPIVQGGDYGDPPDMIRSAYPNWAPGSGVTLENYSSSAMGFRVAKSIK